MGTRKKIGKDVGYVYWLHDFTAPKVFMGDRFECLVTDQIIDSAAAIDKGTGIHISDWHYEIYKPERFADILTPLTPQ